jgi:hypothetical protein
MASCPTMSAAETAACNFAAVGVAGSTSSGWDPCLAQPLSRSWPAVKHRASTSTGPPEEGQAFFQLENGMFQAVYPLPGSSLRVLFL